MKYPYIVNKDGVLYKAGAEVPETPATPTSTDYKKSDISKMNKEELKTLAVKLEIEIGEDSTNEKLKELIIAKLGL